MSGDAARLDTPPASALQPQLTGDGLRCLVTASDNRRALEPKHAAKVRQRCLVKHGGTKASSL